MNTFLKFFMSALILAVCQLNAAQQNVKIYTEVVSAIHLFKLRDLDFGEGLQGDAAKLVSTSEGAEFSVLGEPHRAYSIIIPHTLSMTTGSGSTASEQIQVSNFQSQPDTSGKLDCDGKQTLRIGATRAALLPTQKSGNYLAPFTVTVLY